MSKRLRRIGISLCMVLLLLGEQAASQGLAASIYTPFPGARQMATPLVLDFGKVGVGVTSPNQVVTLTNTGGVGLTNFSGGAVGGDFHAGITCPGVLAPGASCQFIYFFSPTKAGVVTGTSTFSTNAGPVSIQLRGEGVGAKQVASPTVLDFGYIPVNGTSAKQAITITNTGNVTLTGWAGGAAGPDFGGSQNCSSSIAPGASCQFSYDFHPTTVGALHGTTSISTTAGSIVVNLYGTSLAPGAGAHAWYTPQEIDFGVVPVGSASSAMTVTITNNGTDTLTNFTGGAAGAEFFVSQNCTGGVAPGATCQYLINFTPTSVGPVTKTLVISTNGGTITITLHGEGGGAALTVTPLALDFGPTVTGVVSDTQVVNIRNTGLTTLTNFVGSAQGPNFNIYQNCALGVAPGASCQYTFTFTSPGPGRYHKTFSTSTNAGTFEIELYGGAQIKTYLPQIQRAP